MPNRSDGVWRKGQVHCRPHLVVVESGPHSFFSMVLRGENGGLLSCAFGEAMVAQTPIGLVHLSLVCKRKVERQDDMHSSKPLVVQVGGSSFSRNYVLRPMGSI